MANGEINIYGAIRSQTGEGRAAFASQIWDETLQKFQSQINRETANDGLVSAKVAQSFTDTEKAQARTNIGAISGFEITNSEKANRFFKELYIYDPTRVDTDVYRVRYIRRNYFNIIYNITIEKNGSTLFEWYRNPAEYVENSYIEEINEDGKFFKAIVNWDIIQTTDDYIHPVNETVIVQTMAFDLNFSPTILSKDKLDSITQEQFDAIFNFD